MGIYTRYNLDPIAIKESYSKYHFLYMNDQKKAGVAEKNGNRMDGRC